MRKILITGAGGYIGSRMVEFYLRKKYKVVALDRYFFGNVFQDIKNKNLTVVKDDTRYFKEEILKGIDVVIDLASISNDPASNLDPEITKSINYLGALRVARLAKKMNVAKYIFSSSCSIYGFGEGELSETSPTFPISAYAKSKMLAEKDILKLGDNNFCVTILRNATVYGVSTRRMRFDLIINIMTLHSWKNKKIFIMGGGQQWRPLIHIDDLIAAFHKVVKMNNLIKINKQIFNVGSNEQNYQVYQIANIFKQFFNDLVIEEVPDDPDMRSYRVNFDKIKNSLNFVSKKTIKEGVLEVQKALDSGIIIDDIKTNTLEFYRYLINAEKVINEVKLKNKLF